jgi:transposase
VASLIPATNSLAAIRHLGRHFSVSRRAALLRGFAKGLRKDWAAVTAGLTLPYSSGTVEGHVNRIKMIKRQMYGRANPDLLRKRVLLAD